MLFQVPIESLGVDLKKLIKGSASGANPGDVKYTKCESVHLSIAHK